MAEPDVVRSAAVAVEALAAAKQGQAAVEQARAAVEAGADREEVFVALARGFVRSGRPDRGLVILRRLREVAPLKADGVHVELQALIELEEAQTARTVAERWLLIHPEDDVVRRLLARVRPPRACPPGTDRLLDLGRAQRLVAAGHPVRALRTLRQLLLENPQNEAIRLAIRGVVEELRAARKQELERSPQALGNGLGRLARRRSGAGGRDES